MPCTVGAADPRAKLKASRRLSSVLVRGIVILTSLAGVGAMGLLSEQEVNPDSVLYLLKILIGTAANSYLAHAFYKRMADR